MEAPMERRKRMAWTNFSHCSKHPVSSPMSCNPAAPYPLRPCLPSQEPGMYQLEIVGGPFLRILRVDHSPAHQCHPQRGPASKGGAQGVADGRSHFLTLAKPLSARSFQSLQTARARTRSLKGRRMRMAATISKGSTSMGLWIQKTRFSAHLCEVQE